MTLYDDVLDLLDLVGRRDCLTGFNKSCDLEDCEPFEMADRLTVIEGAA